MGSVKAIRAGQASDPQSRLFAQVGAFLAEQRLSPDPANYAFAWQLFSNPDGPLARTVAALTDGGVRLTQRDIDSLDSELRPVTGASPASTEGLMASAQLQVDGFADMVHAIHAETRDFGRNLAASADAIERSRGADGSEAAIDDLAKLTAAMIKRVQVAEAKLENATRDASELRTKLDEARASARKDPLTGLPNRRALEEAHMAHARTGRPMCVAICDVDHFKSVNDRFGHAVGDRVLKAIAEVLSQSCPDHLVARYGGEEFAVLFRDVDLKAAHEILDAARANVAAKRYRLRESDEALGEITFSSGVTVADPDEMLATAMHRADAVLYKAKASGRNCVFDA